MKTSMFRFKDQLFYGWVVVIALLVISTVLYGTIQSYGIFFKSIESEFNLTRTATSAISSANMILAGIVSFGAGYALDKYGPRKVIFLMGLFTGVSLLLTSRTGSAWQLFITYSLLLSMGTGAVYVVPTAAVSRWFNRKRGLALGISGAGSGLGMAVMAPLATYLIVNFDWRTAYIVLGLIAWVIVLPLSMSLKTGPGDVGASVDGERRNSTDNQGDSQIILQTPLPLWQIISGRSFWFIIFIWLFFGCCLFLVFTHLVPHILDAGFSPGEAAGAVSLFGVSAIAGRILMGMVSDRAGRKLTGIVGALLQAGAMLWVMWSQELWMFYCFAVVYGFVYSGFASAMGALIGDVFGLTQIGTIFGILEISFGIGAAIGAMLGGLVHDAEGSYFMAFLVAALLMFLASLLVGLIKRKGSVQSL